MSNTPTVKCYKVTDRNGRDFATGEVDYVDAIGYTLYIDGYAMSLPPRLCSPSVLHASFQLLDALVFAIHYHPFKGPFKVFEVEGRPAVRSKTKYGFKEFTVLRELTNPQIRATLERTPKTVVQRNMYFDRVFPVSMKSPMTVKYLGWRCITVYTPEPLNKDQVDFLMRYFQKRGISDE